MEEGPERHNLHKILRGSPFETRILILKRWISLSKRINEKIAKYRQFVILIQKLFPYIHVFFKIFLMILWLLLLYLTWIIVVIYFLIYSWSLHCIFDWLLYITFFIFLHYILHEFHLWSIVCILFTIYIKMFRWSLVVWWDYKIKPL